MSGSARDGRAYDAVIVGAGHNGLVTAACLARAGLRVLALERRQTVGGAAATEEIMPGFKVSAGAHDASLFRPGIVEALDLHGHGLEFVESPALVFAPQPDGRALTLWRDPQRNREEIARFSKADADRYPSFLQLAGRLIGTLDGLMTLTPPRLSGSSPGELMPWLKVALKMRRLGKRDMMELLRVLPMAAAEFLDGWFESDALKGVLGAAGITGSRYGPHASGTAFMLLYQRLGPAGGGRFVRGGLGQLSAALASAARHHGADLRTGASVARILLKDGEAAGVALSSGEEISARVVVSNADPRRTFFDLVGAPELEPRFMRKVRSLRYRGATAKVNLALRGLPRFTALREGDVELGGHILISPNLEYLERASDDAKYGRVSERPYLDVVVPSLTDPSLAPAGRHVMSIAVQYAPYHLKDGTWPERREALGDLVIDTLAGYAPGLKGLILHRQTLTPLDWECEYGLTEGSIFHGEMGLDQLLVMRPVPGYGQYRTPIERLYLCGAGTHPGGGVTGAPGFNAAREILKDIK